MSKKRMLQNLRQSKVVAMENYERAKKNKDELGVIRYRKEIEKINQKIVKVSLKNENA